MVKHIPTNRGQQPTNCLSVFDRFMTLVLKELRTGVFMVSSNFTVYKFLGKNKATDSTPHRNYYESPPA